MYDTMYIRILLPFYIYTRGEGKQQQHTLHTHIQTNKDAQSHKHKNIVKIEKSRIFSYVFRTIIQ